MLGLIVVLVLAMVLVRIYQIYEPFLDVVETCGERWLVIWYSTKCDGTKSRCCKKLIRLGHDG